MDGFLLSKSDGYGEGFFEIASKVYAPQAMEGQNRLFSPKHLFFVEFSFQLFFLFFSAQLFSGESKENNSNTIAFLSLRRVGTSVC